MNDLNLGVLGVGHIGAVHLQSAGVLPGVSVVAAADAVESNRKLASTLGAPEVYADYESLLAAEPVDAVVVSLPPFLHEEATRRAVDAGCHAFVEKPFARSVEEADRMVEAAAEAGVSLGVDHTLRYQPDVRTLKDAYDSGRLGHVPLCHAARTNSGPFEAPPATSEVGEWVLDPEATGGGAVMDLGVHLFDLLEWFFGGMEVAHAELEEQLDLAYEDTAAITLRSAETGTLATVHCGFYQWEEPPDVNMRVRLDGITDSAESTDHVPSFFRHSATSALRNVTRRLRGDTPVYFEPTYYYRAHFDALRDFIQAVSDGRTPPVSGEDGRRSIDLVEQVYRIADTGKPQQDRQVAAADGGRS